MSQPPAGRPDLSRPLVTSAVLGLTGIVLFIVLYAALAETDSVARLLIAVCVPPAVIAAMIGIYMLVVGRSGHP
jgi:hypothetical protein